ncbi:fungal-specific transcription factor domain-containing protein [Sordaria sp. MPI-SDFR-AT-0083]|nr:fungal-specific transcription factor domain-containing protein [Sordaria sp. MPI-SDFR-AT-0083]
MNMSSPPTPGSGHGYGTEGIGRSGSRPEKRTCITCRARKVKCDGRPDKCTNCERLGFTCSYDPNTIVTTTIDAGLGASHPIPSHEPFSVDRLVPTETESNVSTSTATTTAPVVGLRRIRARQACQSCHVKKAKCSGIINKPGPGGSGSGGYRGCERCRALGIACVLRKGKRGLALPGMNNNNNNNNNSLGDASEMVLDDGGNGMHLDDPRDLDDDMNHNGSITGGRSTASPAPVSSNNNPGPSNRGSIDLPQPDDPIVKRAFDNYFRHVHHVPMFSFLHRASLMERYDAGLLDRALLLAIVGIAALLTDLGPSISVPDPELFSNRCIDEAASICTSELENRSITRLEALVIVVKHHILSKRFSAAFMLHALTSRFANVLRLNVENPALCFLAQESRRRLMWSIYMIDAWFANGQTDLALWPDPERQIRVQLPCNERNFDFDLPEVTEPLRQPPPSPSGQPVQLPDAVGFTALHIRMHWLRTRILQLSLRVVGPSPDPNELVQLPLRCAEFKAELDSFEARLPPSFRWSESNLRLRSYSSRLGIFFMTHVWWRQCHLDLYRLFLPGLKEALSAQSLAQLVGSTVGSPIALGNWQGQQGQNGQRQGLLEWTRQECYKHARAMADMFAQVLALGESSVPLADVDLPGCALQCGRVLYHSFQTRDGGGGSPAPSAEGVREMVSVCLRVARLACQGPASRAIQTDIEKLLAEGLTVNHLQDQPDQPDQNQNRTPRPNNDLLSPGQAAAAFSPGPPFVAMAGPIPLINDPHELGPSPQNLLPGMPPPHAQHAQQQAPQMLPPVSSGPPIGAGQGVGGNLGPGPGPGPGQGVNTGVNPGVAPSQASQITTGSNAFEEILNVNGINFGFGSGPGTGTGADFFAPEAWGLGLSPFPMGLSEWQGQGQQQYHGDHG